MKPCFIWLSISQLGPPNRVRQSRCFHVLVDPFWGFLSQILTIWWPVRLQIFWHRTFPNLLRALKSTKQATFIVNRLDINEFALSCGVQFLSSWFQKLTNSALFNSRVNVSQHKPSKDIKNLFKSLQSIFFGGIFGIEFVCGIISFSLDIIKAINDGFVWNEAFDFSQDIIKSWALRKFQIFSVCNQSSRIFGNFSDLGQRSFIVTMCVIFLSHIDGSEKFRRIHING